MNDFQPGPDQYQGPPRELLDKRLHGADIRGQHLWVMTAAWLIADPASAYDPAVVKLMDRENLIMFSGPGCLKCEEPYSKRIAHRTCRGTVE